MRLVRISNLIRVTFLASLLFASFDVAFAQNSRATNTVPSEDEPTLQALLKEMRLLRITLQRMNLQAYRIQIALEQLRIQQEHVDRLSRQLDEARNELANVRQSREQMAERAKTLEDRLRSDTDEESRAQVANVLQDLQLEMKQQNQMEQTRREREGQLAAQLQSEQTKLDELNDRIQTLEREMEATNSAGAPRPR